MIWESILVMTVFDLVFITVAVVGLVVLGKARRNWPLDDRPVGPAVIVLGLVILGLFYTADLFVMFVLPGIIGRDQSMVLMAQVHQDYSWIVFATSGISVVSGAALTFRTVSRTSADLERSRQEHTATLGQREKTLLDLHITRQNYLDLVSTSLQGIAWLEISDPMPIDLPVDEQIDWLWDETVFTDCNDLFARHYGYSKAAEMIGKGFEALWGKNREVSDARLRQFVENGHVFQGETEVERPNGEHRWFITWFTGIVREGHIVRVVGSQLDITERKKAEMEVAESEERFRVLAAASFEGVTISDAGRILDHNPRAAERLGYDGSDLIGMEVMDLIAPESRDLVRERIRTGDTGPYLFRALRKDGTTYTVEAQARSIPFGGRQVRVSATRDMTHWEEAQRELRESHALLEGFIEGLPDGFTVFDPQGTRITVNPAFCDMTGYSADELIGSGDDHPHWSPENREALRAAFQRALLGDFRSIDLTLTRKDGRPLRVIVSPSCIRAEDGSPRYLFATVKDISERQRMVDALRASEVSYRRLVEDQTEFILKWLPDGTRTFVNDSYCRYFKVSRDEVLGTSFMPSLVEEHRVAVRNRLNSLTPESPVSTGEHSVICPDGSVGWQEWTDRAFFDSSGAIVELQSVGRDITEKRKIADALRSALAELQGLRDQLEAENLYLREEIKLEHDFEQIVGDSEPLRQALGKVEQVAPTDSTVLLLGETGTGKELFARAVHGLSGRAGQPIVKVDCAALPATLIESELFGHEKGAFTGALRKKLGRFELANGGTLFLDEVGDLPLEVQGKLLRVLQDGEFERVGGTEPIHVDVRIVAATNRDLEQAVEAKAFRSDLYYRLNIFPIRLPPLRERPEDIPLLAEHFASKHAKRIGKTIESISGRMLHRLATYPWPGNVRELENRIERAIVSAHGPVLDLPLPTRNVSVAGAARTLQEVERQHIWDVLESLNWVIEGDGGAASVLGLAASTLRSRMRKLGIRRPRGGT